MVTGIDEMKAHFFWWIMLFLLIFSSAYDYYSSYTAPDILQPEHPFWVSILAIVFDVITIIACVGIIVRKYVLQAYFWLMAIVSQIATTILIFYYEFSAGGYTQNEMLLYGNIAFFVTILFLSPLIQYYSLVKKNRG